MALQPLCIALLLFALTKCSTDLPNEAAHSCLRRHHCIYDTQSQEAQCEPGYTWEDADSSDNYRCVPNVVCTPASCEDGSAWCGTVPDGCGHFLSCGECAQGETCGAGGANLCGFGHCTAQGCAAQGAQCDSVNNGCGEIEDCGSCSGGQTCDASHQCSEMPCVPTSCAASGTACGFMDDGCGGTLNCGGCDEESCGNGQIDGFEACDGNNLSGHTCQTLGYDSGTLFCRADCAFDENQCENLTCPVHSHYASIGSQSGCFCDESYQINSAGNACEEIIEEVCDTPNFKFPLTPAANRYSLFEAENNDSQIIMDSHTGYMFERCFAGLSGLGCDIYENSEHERPTYLSMQEAQTYCEELTLGGFSDWELPPMDILLSTVSPNGAGSNGSSGIFGYSLFANAYWPRNSESTGNYQHSASIKGDGNSWGINLHTGIMQERYASSGGYARCVRRTPEVDIIESTPRCLSVVDSPWFDENIIEDSLTGLQWIGCDTSGCGLTNQGYAFGYCAEKGLGNIQWRLPTYREFLTLLDFSRTNVPYGHGDIFPDINLNSGFWTSTKTSSGEIWAVNPKEATTHHSPNYDEWHGLHFYVCVRNVE